MMMNELDLAEMSEAELSAAISERRSVIIVIDDQTRAETFGVTARGEAWHRSAITARAKAQADIKALNRERHRRIVAAKAVKAAMRADAAVRFAEAKAKRAEALSAATANGVKARRAKAFMAAAHRVLPQQQIDAIWAAILETASDEAGAA